MTTHDLRSIAADLAPLCAALRARAQDEANAIRAQAEDDAAGLVERAERDAAAVLEEARREGTAEGDASLAATRAGGRREARGIVLRAQSEICEELARRAREATVALRDDAAYPEMHDRLAALGRLRLGPDATVVDAADGGVVARAGDRQVDLSLPAVAAQALQHVGTVQRLWTP